MANPPALHAGPCPSLPRLAALSSPLRSALRRCLVVAALAACTLTSPGQTPEWIWGQVTKDDDRRFFRKSFTLEGAVERATAAVACDNEADLFINGRRILANREWSQATQKSVTEALIQGTNVVHLAAKNSGGAAGLLVKIDIRLKNGTSQAWVSDATWSTIENSAPAGDKGPLPATGWVAATSLGAVGREPWGNPFKPRTAPPAESLKTLPGFQVELLRSADASEGSWVSMTVDPKGRLLISPQGEEPILRMTLDAQGQVGSVEPIDLPIRGAMGMRHAFGALYVNGQGKDGYHLYRLRDTNQDDKYDTVELIHKWQGGPGEHGAHGIVPGPDGKLYVVNGNFVDVPADVLPTSPHRNYADDRALPRMEDGNGFGAGRKPPGGYVVRMNPDGTQCELFASGERNTYDIAFNPEGELFGFDSDMEWDWGMPWYRPTRVHHVVSGADHGFREGTAKWPEGFADGLPATVTIGIGSPTGVCFGTGAKFPARYQRALYIMDWSYGRIMAVHLKEAGASYSGSFENFIKGSPLNVTDMEVGADGSLYFTAGGRGTQAGLYRVRYTGTESTSPAPASGDATAAGARELRHRLEALHGRADASALGLIWEGLGSEDRWIRYAARIALESVPIGAWKTRALEEPSALRGLHSMLALARLGSAGDQDAVLKTLARWPLDSLNEELKGVKLRVVQVSIARHGLPYPEMRQLAIEKLSRQYPSTSATLNRDLSELLIALDAPGVIPKTLALVDKAATQQEAIEYLVALRKAKSGWTHEEQTRYAGWLSRIEKGRQQGSSPGYPAEFEQWFVDVGSKAGNGASFGGFIKNLRKEFIAGLSPEDKTALAAWLDNPNKAPKPNAPAPARKFVKNWQMGDFTAKLAQVDSGRNFESGRAAFTAAQCAACHKFGDTGGAVGPDITRVVSRFSRQDILSSILEPSKVVSDQYANTTFTQADGEDLTGRVLEEKSDRFVVLTEPLTGKTVELKKSDVKSRRKSALSSMPEGLVDTLSEAEMLDLLAYIESMGEPQHAAFKK